MTAGKVKLHRRDGGKIWYVTGTVAVGPHSELVRISTRLTDLAEAELFRDKYIAEVKHRLMYKVGGNPVQSRKPLDSKSFFYVLRSSEGRIKVGASTNMRQRIGDLQNAHGQTLELILIVRGGAAVERVVKGILYAYRGRGEWFSPPKEIIDGIVGLQRRHGLDKTHHIESRKKNRKGGAQNPAQHLMVDSKCADKSTACPL